MRFSKSLVYRMITTMIDDVAEQERMIEELGVRPTPDQHPLDQMVPIERLNAAHHMLEAYTGDDFVSWRFGYRFELDTLGVLGYLWKHAATLEDMLEHHVAFFGLLADATAVRFEPVDGGRKLEWTPDPAWSIMDRIAMQREFEAAIGFFSKAAQVMTGASVLPIAITMQRPRPTHYPDAFAPYFGLVQFSKPKHAITFRTADLKRPLISHNPHVLKSLTSYAEDVLDALQVEEDLASKIEQHLLHQFDGSLPQIQDVAATFHMSVRHLQRQLSEGGTSFRAIVNRVKFNLARAYLKDRALSVSEVAFILGYAELPAFIRFFRRHAGVSPGDFRLQH